MSVDDKKKDACFHGIGHGLVDILGTDIKKVISNCNFIKDNEGKAQCSHAIFMLFNSIPESRVNLNSIPEDMLDFCKNLNFVYQSYCYDFSGYLTYGKSKSLKKAFANCKDVPDENKIECFRRIGDVLYLFNPKMEPKLLAKQCKDGTSDESLWCSLGIGKLLISDGNNLPERSFEICSLFQGKTKLSCYKELGESLEYLQTKKDRERICNLLDWPFLQACLDTSS